MAPGQPGWNDWYQQKNGEWSRQLIDRNDNVMCVQFRPVGAPADESTDRFYDGKGRRIAKDQALVLVDSLNLSNLTPRSSQAPEGPRDTDRQTSTVTASREPNVDFTSASSTNSRSSAFKPTKKPSRSSADGFDDVEKGLNALSIVEKPMNFDERTLRTTGRLPHWYKEETGKFFQAGRVIRVWLPDAKSSATSNTRDDEIYGTIRPWVVVRPGPASAICVYGNQGVAKPGMTDAERRHHAIIHAHTGEPRLLGPELPYAHLLLEPFEAKVVAGSSLQVSSRVRFDTPRTIQYNIKVRNVGLIQGKEELERLRQCLRNAIG